MVVTIGNVESGGLSMAYRVQRRSGASKPDPSRAKRCYPTGLESDPTAGRASWWLLIKSRQWRREHHEHPRVNSGCPRRWQTCIGRGTPSQV